MQQRTAITIALGILGATLAAQTLFPVASLAQSRLPLAREIADGRPWTMTTTEGRNARMTLNADGTARMEAGPMTMHPTWRTSGEELCITMPIMLGGERCVSLLRTGNTVTARRDGKVEFTLAR
jgi:hypothetical protein